MRKYWILIIFLSIIVIGFAIWFFAPTFLNMHMVAYQISADGTVEQSYPVTIQGSITEKNDSLYVSLDIDFPKDFRYSFINPERSGNIAYAKKESKAGKVIEFAVNDDTYDKETNWPSACYYVVNTKLGYFFAYWPEDGTLVLAATDSNVKVSDLVAYYDGYLQSLVYSDEQDNANAGHEPTEQTTQIDWTMYGTLVNSGGEILETVTFTIQGEITDSPNDMDTLAIYGTFPETFRFDLPRMKPAYLSSHQHIMGTEYFLCYGYSTDKQDQDSTRVVFTLSMQEETMVFHWWDKDVYLIASTAPNADIDHIRQYFSELFEG